MVQGGVTKPKEDPKYVTAWTTQPVTWIPWDRWKLLPVYKHTEVWIPQPAVDTQLPSSKNKTPEISHIILLEPWTHTHTSFPEMCSWCNEIRERQRGRGGDSKKIGKRDKFQVILHNERKIKGKLNKERSFRHKDNKRIKN